MKQRSLYFAFSLSLFVHFALVVGLGISKPQSTPTKVSSSQQVQIDIVEQPKKIAKRAKRSQEKQRYIVEQQEQALNNEVPDDASHLSRNNQKVLKQTVAARSGKFQNAGGKGVNQNTKPPAPVKMRPPIEDSTTAKKPSLASLVPGYRFQPNPKPTEPSESQPTSKSDPESSSTQAQGDGLAQSQTRDHLEDVEKGAQTLLSTREFVYYSYYQRIREQLAQHWESKIREKITNMYRSGRTIASEKNQVTKVVIVLDRSGTLIAVRVVAGSGTQDLDSAAVEAFRLAAPFPNPPKGIEDPDGTIKIRWDFILEA